MDEKLTVNEFLKHLDKLGVEIATKIEFRELPADRKIHIDTIKEYGDDISYINSKITGDYLVIYVRMPLNKALAIKLDD